MKNKIIPKHFKQGFLLLLLFIILGAQMASAKASIHGAEIFLREGIIDLRANHQFRKNDGNNPKGFHTAKDLQVGSIFIDANSEARKVTAIYEENGRTIIETVQPQIEEAMYGPPEKCYYTEVTDSPGIIVFLHSLGRLKHIQSAAFTATSDTTASICLDL